MLNPKETDNFYIQGTVESFTKDSRFDVDAFLETPREEMNDIEVLVHIAKEGKLDPWNVNIGDLADKYMIYLAKNKSNSLRTSGRALFFLAVLLKMKSNVLVGLDPLEFEPQPIVDPDYPDGPDESRFPDSMYDYPDNVISIEDVIQRRTSVKLNRNRVVTLKDLIRQLEFYEQLEKKQQIQGQIERAQRRRVRNYGKMSADDIINLAHEEYIESSVKILHENLINIFEKEERVELTTLTMLGLDKISAYIALLFLTVESEFDLEQDEFYSDLYVVKGKMPERLKTEEDGQSA